MSHNDHQANENENHLIGNILAEDNSDSENEDNRSGGHGFHGGGSYGLHQNAPYTGTFNHIPDRVGSAPAVDFSVKFGNFGNESPQNRKHQNPFGAGPESQNFQNLGSYGGQQDPNIVGELLRRGSGLDQGGMPQSKDIPIQQQMLAQQQMNQDQPQYGQDYNEQKQQDIIYSTKQYYDYYHSLKPRDPRLPKPTYQPHVDLDIFKQLKKQNEQNTSIGKQHSLSDEFENKMGSLNLDDQAFKPQSYEYSHQLQNQQQPDQLQPQPSPMNQPQNYNQYGQMQYMPFQGQIPSQMQPGQEQQQPQTFGFPGYENYNTQQNQSTGQGKGKRGKNKNNQESFQMAPPPGMPPKPKIGGNQQFVQMLPSYPAQMPSFNQPQNSSSMTEGFTGYEQPQPYFAPSFGQNNQAFGMGNPQTNQGFKKMRSMDQNQMGFNQYQFQQQWQQNMGGMLGQGIINMPMSPPQNTGVFGQNNNNQPFNQQQFGMPQMGMRGQSRPNQFNHSLSMNSYNQMMPNQHMPRGQGFHSGRGGAGRGGKRGGHHGHGNNSNQYPGGQGNQPLQLPKSQFLEELREKIQNGKKIEIKDIKDHVVECARDQYGSRFIQQKYDITSAEEKELIFSEILPEAYDLMNDVFGNYVVQKLFEYGTNQQRATLAEQLVGNVLILTKSMYGCRVVQKALEVISLPQQNLLVSELKDSILDCIHDQNGNHVIQKCIEKMPSGTLDFIVQPVIDHVFELCVHTYGCRVIQRILEHCLEKQARPIIDQILAEIHTLTKNEFGNYVIQHILEHGKFQGDKNKIVKSIKGKVIELSNHKFASNVVEKCLQYGSEKDRKEIIDEFMEATDEEEGTPVMNGPLYQMMKDRYGNYVIQKCIEFSKGQQRELLLKKITTCANVLRKQANYSRHVYNFIEKLLAQESGSTQTQGGPKQGHGHSAHNGQSVNSNHYEHVNTYIFGANQMSSGDVDNIQPYQPVYRQNKRRM